MSTAWRRAGWGALTVLAMVPLAACSPDPAQQAHEVLDTLTGSLAGHTLAGVALTDPTDADQFAGQVDELTQFPVSVTAEEAQIDGDAATTTLHWAWDLNGKSWTYDTTVGLVRANAAWQVDWSLRSLVPNLVAGEQLAVRYESSERADVLDVSGEPIVTERAVERYGLDKSQLDEADVADAARAVAEAVGVEVDPYVAQAEAMGPAAFVEAITLRQGEGALRVDSAFSGIPGAFIVDDEIPLAPTRDYARELLGVVGAATAEIIEASDGTIRDGDQVGLSGLQAQYDSQLRGRPAVTVVAAGTEACVGGCVAGDERELAAGPGVAGDPLTLTLDEAIQSTAEQVLAEAGDETSPVSAIVAIRPSTGAVVAVANGPGNDGFNAATTGQYAPGSTFKLVTALALLRAGVQPDDVLSCPETVTVDGYTFANYDDYPADALGDVSFRTAIANSCNTALIGARDRIGEGDLADAASSLGLVQSYELGYPAYLGQVPEPTTETERAANQIGQGTILASPLAMATVAASIASGTTVVPTLIDGIDVAAEPSVPLAPEEAAELQSLMRAVVTEGSASFLQSVPGEPVGAKTGTAEYGSADESGDIPTHAWMVGTHDDLAVAVFVETGESGATTAGPLLQRMFEAH